MFFSQQTYFLTREGGVLLDQNILTTRKNIFFTGGGDTNFFNVFILTTRKELFNHKMLFFFHRNMKK